jgi:hypothetical protein
MTWDMHILGRLSVTIASLLLFGGCASYYPRIPSWSFEPITPPRPLITEPPKGGKILVYIGGNARHHGPLWVYENASLATIEDLVALPPNLASRHVEITRIGVDGKWTLSVRINRMHRREKEEIGMRHGDAISFFWDRCFGAVDAPPLINTLLQRKVGQAQQHPQTASAVSGRPRLFLLPRGEG